MLPEEPTTKLILCNPSNLHQSGRIFEL